MFALEQVCNWKLFVVGPVFKKIVKMHYSKDALLSFLHG